jgi:predicted ATPase
MITNIKINGFKSFHNFEMEFTPFTVVAGVNASGKSNLFDAMKLLSNLAESDKLKKAFMAEQRGDLLELFTQINNNEYATEMEFCVEMLVNRTVKDAWGNESSLKYTRLRYELKIKRYTNDSGIEDLTVTHEHLENLRHGEDVWLKIINKDYVEHWRPKVKTGKRGIPYIQTVIDENGIATVEVPQDGTTGNKRRFHLINAGRTVLSSFDTIDFPHVLAAKEEMKSWKFWELSSEDLRQPTSKQNGDDELTQSGKNLAAVLYRIKQDDVYYLKEISRKLQTFLPNFTDVDVIDDAENKQYVIKLKDKDKKEYSSRVLSEGTLRLLTLCIMQYDDRYSGLLCFEEPENGIHPARISEIAKLLKEMCVDFTNELSSLRQIIINTHSPVLIGHIFKWKWDRQISIWYAEMRERVTEIHNKRSAIRITIILPVIKDNEIQISFEVSEQDRKLTLSKVTNYLETASSLM